MAYDRVPMFIDGGALHPGAIVRNGIYKQTQGATGIGGIGDLRVHATPTPGATVVIEAGTYVVENKYASASPQQSYSGRNYSPTALAIPATGSAQQRTDLIVFRIDDPEYSGATVDYATFEFQKPERISNVPTAAIASPNAAAAWLKANRAYPCVALAGIVIPASTATITNAMIKDLREMANPRRQRSLSTFAISTQGQSETQTATGAGGEQWPNAAGWNVEIPYWATQVRGIATWAGVVLSGGNVNGELYWRLGSDASGLPKPQSQTTKYDNVDQAGVQRVTAVAADTVAIPAALRGQIVFAHLRARLSAGAGRAKVDWASSLVLDLEFLEAPTQDAI